MILLSHSLRALRLFVFGWSAVIAGVVCGQEDPFGATPRPAGEAAPASGAARAGGRLPALVEREPLAIELLRASNPTSPRELLSAAQTAMQFGRPDESKKHLAKLLADKPGNEQLAALTGRYAPFLLQLESIKEIQPEGKQVAELVLSAAQRVARDEARIAGAIGRLSSDDPGARQGALAQLADGGAAVVNPMLSAMSDAARGNEHANIRLALVQLGRPVELPLIAALDATQEPLKKQIIAVLGRMGSHRAIPFLIRPALDPSVSRETRDLAAAAIQRAQGAAPDLPEARRYLNREITDLLRGNLAWETDSDDRATLWTWDASSQHVVQATLARDDAGLYLAARMASDLYVLTRDLAAQRLMLLTSLELAKVVGGFDRPIPTNAGSAGAVALIAGPQVLNQVLADAIQAGRTGAAMAAAELLGQARNASVLHTANGESPLAYALRSSDRRVRLAAGLAAIELAPGEAFPGSGRLGETLAWFANTRGENSVLIGHPRGEEAQTLVGYANALGFEGEGTYRGRGLAERAFVNPDFSYILISDAIDKPPVEELVQWLRRDYRTAHIPVGVMARGERLLALEEAFADDKHTSVFPRIHSIEVCNSEIAKLRAMAARNFVDRDERTNQARAALAALEQLAKRPAAFAQYDLLAQQTTIIGALDNPALAAQAARLLALFPTSDAQMALVNFASQGNRLLADRQAAAAAFAASVQGRGILLTQSHIAQQYGRYNASQSADKGTQELLGSILDAIEGPAIARGELRQQP